MRSVSDDPTDADLRALAEWRSALRRFLASSERIARREGVSPAQYQLILFVGATPDGRPPAIGDLARRMQVEHQSAVAYGNRFANGYLERDWTGIGISTQFDFIIVHSRAIPAPRSDSSRLET